MPIHANHILVVDDDADERHLLTTVVARGGLSPRPVSSGRLAIESALADRPDLVLVDLLMPEMSGLETCRWFKRDPRLRNIPVIFVSGVDGPEDKVAAFRAGAVDYVCKPFDDDEVLARISAHLQLRQSESDLLAHNAQLKQVVTEQVQTATAAQLTTIFALVKLSESRDDDVGRHIDRVQAYSAMLAESMRALGRQLAALTDAFIDTLYLTACLHDVGKVGIPDSVLLKPARLTDEEFAVMKEHCVRGADTLAVVLERYPDNEFLRMGVQVARSHPERWDGTGYPDGLAGSEIPLSARIVALADFYDALTSKRCYRAACGHQETVEMIRSASGSHFDPDVVEAFLGHHDRFDRVRRTMIGA